MATEKTETTKKPHSSGADEFKNAESDRLSKFEKQLPSWSIEPPINYEKSDNT